MNTARLTTRFPRVAACALALAGFVLAGAASPAHASNADKSRSVVVDYRDLDLSTDQGNLKLYQRIAAAAARVCPLEISRDLDTFDTRRACISRAIASAVSQVGSPLLASVFAEQARHG